MCYLVSVILIKLRWNDDFQWNVRVQSGSACELWQFNLPLYSNSRLEKSDSLSVTSVIGSA